MSVPSVTPFRACKKCGCTKPLTSDFWHREKTLKTGFGNKCKMCRRADNRRWLADNKEYRREYSRKWEENNKESRSEMYKTWAQANADERREYARRFATENADAIAAYPSSQPEAKRAAGRRSYRKNKDRIAERVKKDRRENPDKYRVYFENYVAKHGRDSLNAKARARYAANRERMRERFRVHAHKRRTRKNPEAGFHTFEEVWQMLEDQGHVCAYCEVPLFGDFEIEHMMPVSRGGGNTWENIAVACTDCNRSKGAKTTEEFMAVLGYDVVNTEALGA